MSDDARPVSKVARRTLIAGAAWAVPTVAVLSATPAFAASSSLTKEAVSAAYAPNVGTSAGKISLWSAQVKYDPNAWGVAWNAYPTTAVVKWRVVVLNSAGTVVATLVDEHSVTLVPWGSESKDGSVNVPAGSYTVVTQITSATFTPPTVNSVTFHNLSVDAATSVVVP